VADVSMGSAETRLEFTCVDRRQDGNAELLRAGLVSPGLAVQRTAYDYEGYGASAAFFEDMARDWRGWAGERRYASLERDLDIVARHDGHVRLAIRINQHANRPLSCADRVGRGLELRLVSWLMTSPEN
jgi:hypothetical protein